MNPLLSIITPVYNVEAYLTRCVNSILTQSYREIQLILVDDGSTDNSSSLCDEWAAKDCRVVVIHKENGGVSSARNTALEAASGKYLTFVDPDDFIAPDTYYANMAYLIEHQDVDILQYPYCHYFKDGETTNFHQPFSALLLGKEEIFRNWWSGTPLEYVIWNKIYKRSLWNGVTFEVGHISEDTCLVPIFVQRTKSVYISEQGLYNYQRDRKESYTYGEYSFEKHLDLFFAHAAIYECFQTFPELVTEKVLAFTRLYRRLITAKQTAPAANIQTPLKTVKKYYPSFHEIFASKGTEKMWLMVSKVLGVRTFIKLFSLYLKVCK